MAVLAARRPRLGKLVAADDLAAGAGGQDVRSVPGAAMAGVVKCFCGCGAPAAHEHHVIYQQELRRAAGARGSSLPSFRVLAGDRRNIVAVAFRCHHRHHSGTERYLLARLPDSVFEFAGEVLGPGPGYESLRRRYAGEDPRLDAMLEDRAA